MNLAVISVCALVLAVIVSCVSRLNVGVLAIALAWIVGVYLGGIPVNTVMAGFPSQLCLTLIGVTLLFALAQTNGTLERITDHAVRLCRGNCGTIPIMFFGLGAVFSSAGPGNIATGALLAPLAMATAVRSGIPLFLMAIMVGNGANSGALSPFAPTGIIVNGLMARNGLGGLEWRTFLYNFAAHVVVAFTGYLLLGGLKLFSAGRTDVGEVLDGQQTTFQRRHWITIGVIALVIVSVVAAKANVGMAAFFGAVILVLTGSADDSEAFKRMPWRVIVMVCGVTVLIALVERTQGIDLLVSLVARVSSAQTVTAVTAFLTAIVSVYSSTSGVVLPAFLPLVPGLVSQLPGASAVGIASAMNVGGHLVDLSPLSTLGALCLAGAPPEDSRGLFNRLLAWGLSMSVVGAFLCYLLF
jgi:di/tricarboxylate transporter